MTAIQHVGKRINSLTTLMEQNNFKEENKEKNEESGSWKK
jgi:hypothetical protein